ncbi:MAG: rod shape-determining protein MreC [Gammaproteobacteria bacterium]|nr:rod shape-determining protein MreC [Gammaproteobacteria bacterium]
MVEMNALFQNRTSLVIRAIILIMFSIALMIADHRWNHLENLRKGLSNIIYPLRYTINIPAEFVQWIDESITSHNKLLEDNKRLKADHLLFEARLQKMDTLELENQRLRSLLGTPRKASERVLIAEIFSVEQDPYKRLININKDADDGAYIGQAIIDAYGIMGQIIHVNENSSTVMLISDSNHAIPIQINRTGLRGTVFGTGDSSKLELRFIPHNANIKEGDIVSSSGLGGRFPPNYPVGVINSIERPAGETFASIDITPSAKLDQSREVLMLWHNAPADTNSLESPGKK